MASFLFSKSPFYESFVRHGAANPVVCFRVNEKRHAPAAFLVVLLHELRVVCIVPHLVPCHLDVVFFLEFFDNWRHHFAEVALCAVEFNQFWLCHAMSTWSAYK